LFEEYCQLYDANPHPNKLTDDREKRELSFLQAKAPELVEDLQKIHKNNRIRALGVHGAGHLFDGL
jgi:hypothetical protein